MVNETILFNWKCVLVLERLFEIEMVEGMMIEA